MSSQVNSDSSHCVAMGKLLAGYQFRDEAYARPFLRFDAPREIKLRTYFYSVAICHQTHHLYSAKLNLWGWDYIEAVFTDLAMKNSPLLQPGYLSSFPFDRLKEKLAALFSDDDNPSNTTLDRIDERVTFLAEADKMLHDRFDGSLQKLFAGTGGRLISNGKGFYEILTNFMSFSDPMKKKITFLLKLLGEAGLITIADPENFIPIMDYHMQRALLRTGCVEVHDKLLAEDLRQRRPMQSDVPVRNACIDAFNLISVSSGIPVIKLNDIFWSLGRSCCHEILLCQTGKCEKTPCTLTEFTIHDGHKKCAIQEVCKGFEDEKYRQFWQPMTETHYY